MRFGGHFEAVQLLGFFSLRHLRNLRILSGSGYVGLGKRASKLGFDHRLGFFRRKSSQRMHFSFLELTRWQKFILTLIDAFNV